MSSALAPSRVAAMTLIWWMAVAPTSRADDWSTWRCQADRSASTSERLPANLNLQWTRRDRPPEAAWPEDTRLMFDAAYEPIVVGDKVFVASSLTDSITAVNVSDGTLQWRFFADGPIRFAPCAWKNKIFFGCDDGFLYAVDAKTGELHWKLDATPASRKAIGNDRLISVWPLRGGPVIHDDHLYFTSGVWPFEGTFLYDVDLQSGESLPDYEIISLPVDILPQGYLAIADNNLLIPCGRGKVRKFDLESRQLRSIKYDSRSLTDYHVASSGKWMFHGDRVVNLSTNRETTVRLRRPIAVGTTLYAGMKSKVIGGIDLEKPVEQQSTNSKGEVVTKIAYDAWSYQPELSDDSEESNNDGRVDEITLSIHAGGRLYGYSNKRVFALDLPNDNESAPNVSWWSELDEHPASMIAAAGRLFVTTREGSIHCFGAEAREPIVYKRPNAQFTPNEQDRRVTDILAATNSSQGYCVVVGVDDGMLVEELLRQSDLRLVVLDKDAQRIANLRRRLAEKGVSSKRVETVTGNIVNASLPPYLANLIVSEDWNRADLDKGAITVEMLFATLRPYGGSICFELEGNNQTARLKEQITGVTRGLTGAELVSVNGFTLLNRPGRLEGAGDWTDEYGDAANSLMSGDKLVKPPLGVLWFGGPASHPDLFYDRHQWASSAIVIGGRMFMQGPQVLTAVDVYTGRILWKVPLEKGLSPGRRANWESTGFHFLATADSVYLTYEKVCTVLDAETGNRINEIRLPDPNKSFGRIRIWNDLLIVPGFKEHEEYGPVPQSLIAMNRHDGTVLWELESEFSFPFVAIGKDRIYAFEALLAKLYQNEKRHGNVPDSEPLKRVIALDILTGKPIWKRPTNRVVTWLSYSEMTDVVVASDKTGVEAYLGANGSPLWSKEATGTGFRGHPENLWDKVVLWNDRIIDQRGPGRSYDLLTGKENSSVHPISNQPLDWEFTKIGHHCNYAIAGEHLMTFRADSAGYLDLTSSGTSHLRGFRSGCRNSLIPADGVLNAPNYANGCICSYSLFTSLALVHVPEAEKWSYSAIPKSDKPIDRVGINLGAPGDRLDDQGVLWLDYPSVGGPSPDVDVTIKGADLKYFRHHSSRITGPETDKYSWIASSGVEGLEEISIKLGEPTSEVQVYRVELFWIETGEDGKKRRTFDVSVNGKIIFDDLNVLEEAGGPWRVVAKELQVEATDELTVQFGSRTGDTMLSGLRVTRVEQETSE